MRVVALRLSPGFAAFHAADRGGSGGSIHEGLDGKDDIRLSPHSDQVKGATLLTAL